MKTKQTKLVDLIKSAHESGVLITCGLVPKEKVPAKGMKHTPIYFNSPQWDILLGPLWSGLCQYLISKEEARADFQKDTGRNLDALINRSPFDAMIDRATGYQSDTMAAWCDWVTEKHWGIEPEQPITQPPTL